MCSDVICLISTKLKKERKWCEGNPSNCSEVAKLTLTSGIRILIGQRNVFGENLALKDPQSDRTCSREEGRNLLL